MTRRMIRTQVFFILTAIFAWTVTDTANAQFDIQPAGVEIDASGVLRMKMFNDATGALTRQRIEAAKASLDAELMAPSQLRKVSLNRLESEIGRRLDSGEGLDDAIRNLAGLTQITHVFYYPETKDVVVAGPAEGFFTDVSGRIIGMQSGKAIMRLEDLLVALRSFPPNGKSNRVIGCSIDPTQEGLTRFQASYAQLKRNFRPGQEAHIVETLSNALGMQKVTVQGVSPKTHFAQVLVEADYRMKLIGIGLETPPVRIKSFVEYVNPSKVADRSMQRWYFTPDYKRVLVNQDETAMQLVGQGVKLVGADERVTTTGARVQSSRSSRASRNFTREFTENFAALAEQSPVFAELRNLMDMSIVAAFIQEMDFYGQADWEMSLLADEQALSTELYNTPTQVAPAINAIWKRGMFMTPIGGGVTIQPRAALDADNMQIDETGQVDELANKIKLHHLADGQWWWD